MNKEHLENIAEELCSLNNNILAFMFLLSELLGKPLEFINSDGNYKFREELKNE